MSTQTPLETDDSISIDIQLEAPFDVHISPDWLRTVAQAVFAHMYQPTSNIQGHGAVGLTLVITDDETVRSLNRTYLGNDAPTDVLSFGGKSPDFVTTPEADQYLGDVIISYPRAQAQATAAGHEVEAELALLVVHGMLHLWGYDHVRAKDKTAMWTLQRDILARLGMLHVAPSGDEDNSR
jgi:probable rRNA maturation factor